MKITIKEDLQLTSQQREDLIGYLCDCRPDASDEEKEQLRSFTDYDLATIGYHAEEAKKLIVYEKQKEESRRNANKGVRNFVRLAKKLERPCYICGQYEKGGFNVHELRTRNIPYQLDGLVKSVKLEAPSVPDVVFSEEGAKIKRYRHPSCQPKVTAQEVAKGLMLDEDETKKLYEFAEAFEIDEKRVI